MHSFEPYEFGREENVLFLHVVKSAAELLVSEMQEAEPDERKGYSSMIGHVSADLKEVMRRRSEGLDEDWSEDALSAEEEVAEDRDLLDQITEAVASITGAKGVGGGVGELASIYGVDEHEAEAHLRSERTSDVMLGLLAHPERTGRGGGEGEEGDEEWETSETHEGCMIFGYVEVSRAPGTLHVYPHSQRHSFNFSSLNTSHTIDHLSFGLELSSRERARLPASVGAQLTPLDGSSHAANLVHETFEHHVNVMPTSVGGGPHPIETFQFTATSHGRTRETLPSLIISYDVSPIRAHIEAKAAATSDFIVSLCAIIGGAFSIFGIVDGVYFASAKALRSGKKL